MSKGGSVGPKILWPLRDKVGGGGGKSVDAEPDHHFRPFSFGGGDFGQRPEESFSHGNT